MALQKLFRSQMYSDFCALISTLRTLRSVLAHACDIWVVFFSYTTGARSARRISGNISGKEHGNKAA